MKSFSFTKNDRILKHLEFSKLSASGKRLHNRYFTVIFRASRHGRSRLGITVSKKIGCAVVRNRIKRVIREYFRTNRHKLQPQAWDINIIAKKEVAEIAAVQVFSSLHDIFVRISREIQ